MTSYKYLFIFFFWGGGASAPIYKNVFYHQNLQLFAISLCPRFRKLNLVDSGKQFPAWEKYLQFFSD